MCEKLSAYWRKLLIMFTATGFPCRRRRHPPAIAATKPTHNFLPTYSLLPCAQFTVRVAVGLSARSFMPSMHFLIITMSPTSWLRVRYAWTSPMIIYYLILEMRRVCLSPCG
jgi:hypothetical protein